MKLSQYAKKYGISYRTAFRWWQNGQIKGFQKPSGTIIVTEAEDDPPQARKVVSPVVNLAENNREDLLQDLSSIVYSVCARLYGQRRAKRKKALIGKILAETEAGEQA